MLVVNAVLSATAIRRLASKLVRKKSMLVDELALRSR